FAQIRAAIPLDLRRYARYTGSIDELFASKIGTIRQQSIALDAGRTTLASAKRSALFDQLFAARQRTSHWTFKQLTVQQREDLLYVLLLDTTIRPWSERTLSSPLPPHFADVKKTTLQLFDNLLMRGYREIGPDGEPRFMGDGARFSPGARR